NQQNQCKQQQGQQDDALSQRKTSGCLSACRGFSGCGRLDAVAAHQQTMCVDTVRGAGVQGDQIFARDDLQRFHLVGKGDQDLVHFISQHTVQNGESKGIAFFQL